MNDNDRTFFVFSDHEDAPETCAHVPAPNVGDVVRFYVDAFHGRDDVIDAADHLKVDGVPWRVASVERAVCRTYNGDWRTDSTVRLVPHVG